ncbi:MAG: LacI family transcriptional regulator, partial [Microbacterium sp.]
WPRGSETGDDRERGWREACGGGPRLVASDDVQHARAVVTAAIEDVDAVVCASDTLAVGAHLADARLPVYGFDNTPVAEALCFPSVEQHPERVAAGALGLLLGPSGNVVTISDPPGHLLVEPRLVLR